MSAVRRRPGWVQRLVTTDGALGALWVVAAIGLAGGAGRRGRRSALRGALAAGAAATGARLAAPAAVRRTVVPVAAVAGFGAGAAQELPVAAAGLVPAVAASALLLGRRRGGSGAVVAAGVLAGIGVGFASRRAWKVAPAEAAAARRTWTPLTGEPSPDGEGLAVLVNPSSGPAWSGDPTDALRTALPDARVERLEEGDDLAERVEGFGEVRALGIAGGDGTVNALAELALDRDVPLLVVPAGTLNHFARDLGVDSVADAASAVVAGEQVAVDVGLIDGRPFLNTASFGSYAALVDARERLESRIGKWPAVVVALVHVLRHERPTDVEIDGRPYRVWMIFIGNCRYEPDGLAPSWRERLDDGLLDVRLVDGSAPLSRLRLVVALLTGRLAQCPAYRRTVVHSLRIRSTDGPLRLARDGETFDGGTDIEVTKAPKPLRVLRPAGVGPAD